LRTLVKRSNVDPTNIKYYGIPIVSFLGHGLAGIIDHIAGKIPLSDFLLYSIAGVARLFYSGAIFSNFECSQGRKFITNMRQINRGVEGFKTILKICLQICENLKRFLKCSSKMSYFGFKKSNFLK
jgi:hypothetical protein